MTRLLTVLFALFALTLSAEAHQQKITISTLSHNPRTDMLEVVHRIPLHDAEHALKAHGVKVPDIIGDVGSRREFARYVTERFTIHHDGAAISLNLLGSEIEGGHLLIYQESPSPGPGTVLRVQSAILTDIWSRQENRVNFGAGSRVETLVFRSGDKGKTAQLP